MTSVLQSRKAAGAGNYFLALDPTDNDDNSGTAYFTQATLDAANAASPVVPVVIANAAGYIAAGTVLRDMGKRVYVRPAVAADEAGNAVLQEFALVHIVGGAVGLAGQYGYVCIRDTTDTSADLLVKVVSIGGGVRN
jgi:hypothetical protein